MISKLRLLLLLLVGIISHANGQLTITNKSTVAQAISVVQNDFITGSGLSGLPTNIVYRGGPEGLATFTGTSNLGIDTGIILTSGHATVIDNPHGLQFDFDNGVSGDPDLQTLSSQPITDVASLEFDFVPKTDTIRFKYSFASEEYPEYVCAVFNDVFGFFVTGPKPGGGTYNSENVALIPGTTLPVGVNTVNPGVSGGGGSCNLPNQSLAYSAYYVSNLGSTIIFDGFTVVMEIKIPVLQCGNYHIKLAVSDAGTDGVFDSGVFLRSHSFGGGPIHVYDTIAGVAVDTSIICTGETITLTAPNSNSYSWSNSLGNTQSVNISVPGTYGCFVFNPANGCANPGYSYHVIASDAVGQIDTLGPMTLCPGDSVQLFSAFPGSAYQWSNGATTSSIWVDYTEVGIYTLTVTDRWGRCDSVSKPVTVYSGTAAAVIDTVGPTAFCAGGSVTLNANPGTSYLWSNGATTQGIIVSTPGPYSVTVTNAGCTATSAITNVVVNAPVVAIVASGPLTFCQGSNVTLTATPGFTSYNWTNGPVTAANTITASGSYTVTVIDNLGCFATSNVSVTVNSATASIAAHTDSILCTGDSIQLTAGSGNGYLWSNGKSTQSIWASAAGAYTVVVTNANSCTATSAAANIYMSALPAGAIISPANDTTICIGSNISIIANNGVSYNWSNGATTSVITLAPATLTNYTVAITNGDGCIATPDVKVTVNNPVVTIFNIGSLTFCVGDSVLFMGTPGFSNYAWSNGQTGVNHQTTIYNAGNVFLIATDADGCTANSNVLQVATDSATVSVALSTDTVLCPLEQITLTSTAASSYLWSNAATTAAITTGAGIYTVTVTNANGCKATSSPITISQSTPTASIVSSTGFLVFCPDSSIELQANAGGSIYNWSTGAASQNITINTPGTYTVTVTNSDNCSIDASIGISVSNPVANIITSGPTTFCLGSDVILTANNLGGGVQWSDGSTTQSITVNAANTYGVTVSDIYGCPAFDNETIVVNQATATISPSDSTFCNGDSIQLFNTSANTVSVLWSNGVVGSSIWVNDADSFSFILTDINGCKDTSAVIHTLLSVPAAIITPQTSTVVCPGASVVLEANVNPGGLNTYLWSDGSTSLTYNALANGVYTVTVTVTNYLGCVEVSDPVTIIESIPFASIAVTGPTSICPNQQANLTANFGASYIWSNNETSRQIITSAGGNYTVEVTDTAGCVATSLPVTITNLPAEAFVTVSGATEFCRGGSVIISATTPGLNYLWSNGSTDSVVTINDNVTLTVDITNLNGCVARSNPPVVVKVYEYPVISFTADSSSECDAFKIRFRNYSTYDSGSSFAWTFGDSVTSNQSSPIHWYTVNGIYNVSLAITTPFGCASVDSSEIEIVRYPDPVSKFIMESNIENVFAGPIVFINESENANRYLWDFGDQSGSTEANPTHDYREPGYYKISLTAYNPANCENKEIKEVTVAPLFIPSAFTPNGDGRNDIFPGGLPADMDVNSYEVNIYNRWGQRIFHSENPAIGWNGTDADGSKAQSGSYVYEMKISDRLNKAFAFRGNLNLMR
ncbi:MAG: choice-of-anchor L domain-containing protein [Bacteroidota bacterium]